ncbi:starch synthase catalytic domain-containing protein [Dunaliella salina]|uniref:Starch synthase catalytic domain-containing protein n=1 Tax=Dunaliella salina TaxID=3046 RepID=A0ABQ7GQ27_DUNSA|nr:starch synthase catalytic domain-containing protein [Dunaliella salina]|eukprot:KAF5836718.1 starch synthase catalytic domain-containing protein [Dunaliella salina]
MKIRFDQYSDAWDTSITLNVDGQEVRYFHCVDKYGVDRVWVDHPWFLAKVWGKTGSKLYGADSGADYVDNHKRFSMFCKAALEAARVLPFGVGEDCVFVANDWHSSVVPVLLKDVYQPRGEFAKAKVALCIHNIAFQGRMWEDVYKEMNLPESSFEKFQFSDGYPKVYNEITPLKEDEKGEPSGGPHRKINWLKAGILSADKVLTVSPNYAAEIGRDDSSGVELDNYIRQVGGAEGIVNGMDVEEWDPRMDKYLAAKYDKSTVHAGKAAAKEALQYGTVPIVASTGGLVDTVKEGKTGFHMGAMDPSDLLVEDAEALASTVGRAAKVFSTPQYKEMVVNCISQDLSWSKPAIKWESILHELWKGVPSTKTASIVTPVQEPIPGPPGKAAVEKPLTRTPPPVIPMPPLTKTAPTPAAAGAPSTNGVPKAPTPAAAPAPKVAAAAAPAPKVAPISPATAAAAAPSPKVAPAGAAPSSNGAPATAAPPAPKTEAKTRAQQAAAPGRKK